MDDNTLGTLIRIVVLIHAIGHVQGIVVALGLFSTESWNARSWLLTDLIGAEPSRILALVVWVVLTLGFLLVFAGTLGWAPMVGPWRGLAVILAIVSLAAIILYWNSFALIFNKIGAIAVDVVAIVGILFAHWPSTDLLP